MRFKLHPREQKESKIYFGVISGMKATRKTELSKRNGGGRMSLTMELRDAKKIIALSLTTYAHLCIILQVMNKIIILFMIYHHIKCLSFLISV